MAEETPRTTPEMLDRYELIALLARGGMGAVHLARLPGVGGFQRLYAIKVMHPHLAEESEFVDMLLDEARIAARIHHPNAVPIVDICQSDRGFYLVMDYIDGVNLARYFQRTAEAPWRARVRVALRVLVDALRGLHAAHELTDDDGQPLGLVHRDVSPQNILVGTDGVGRITDFGIALAASRIAASRPGMIKGKPSYMSPEQVSAGPVDRRADLFSIGIVLWEALTGQRLFQADTEMGALMQVISGDVPAPRSLVAELSEGLEGVCLKALSSAPEARFDSARVMAEHLEAAAAEAAMLASAQEVADFLREHFSADFDKRRALLRSHARGVDGGLSLSPGRGGDVERPVSNPSRPGVLTGKTAQSLPAIEVASTPRVHPMEPGVALVAARGTRRGVWLGVAAFVVVAAGGGWMALCGARGPGDAAAQTGRGQPPVTAVQPPAEVEARPVPAAPSVTTAVAEPPVAVGVDAATPPAVLPAVAAPSPVRRSPRSERPLPVARPAAPAAPAAPTIESNPYLQR